MTSWKIPLVALLVLYVASISTFAFEYSESVDGDLDHNSNWNFSDPFILNDGLNTVSGSSPPGDGDSIFFDVLPGQNVISIQLEYSYENTRLSYRYWFLAEEGGATQILPTPRIGNALYCVPRPGACVESPSLQWTSDMPLDGGSYRIWTNVQTGDDSSFYTWTIVAAGSDDTDGDGWADVDDNCPLAPNPQQEDGDEDTVGDACDNCISIANPDQEPSAANPNCGAACETSGCFGLVCENH